MTVILKAPAISPETVTILPNPELADVENSQKSLFIKRAMDGTKRTYVRRSPNRLLTYVFRLQRLKMLELEAFVRSYQSQGIWMTNHKGEMWTVQFVSNPFEFGIDRRQNDGVITLNLEGFKSA